jgi:hypothetical protein
MLLLIDKYSIGFETFKNWGKCQMRPTLIKIRKQCVKYLILLSISLFLSIFITNILTRDENLKPNPIHDGIEIFTNGVECD